jgi:hypothetical protein
MASGAIDHTVPSTEIVSPTAGSVAGDLTGEIDGHRVKLRNSLLADGNQLSYVSTGLASGMESPATSSLENTAARAGEHDGTPPPANGKTAGQ